MPCSHRVPSKRKHRRFIPGICATIEAWEQWLRAASINHLLHRLNLRFHSIKYDVFPASSSSVTHAGDCLSQVCIAKEEAAYPVGRGRFAVGPHDMRLSQAKAG